MRTFPQTMNIAGNHLPLTYVFEPGAASDGITLNVPEQLLEELDAEQLAWLVPGARQEKIAELLRSLPKAIRRQLVPVTDHARLALESVTCRAAAAVSHLARRLDHGAGRHPGQGRGPCRSACCPIICG